MSPCTADRGFTLVEVLIAAAILATALLALASSFAMGIKQNAVAKEETVMAAFAQDKMEQLRKLPKSTLDGLYDAGPPNCQQLGTDACYASDCPQPTDPPPDVETDGTKKDGRHFYAVEDPIHDPNPADNVQESMYTRYWRVERVDLGQPVGCVYKITVIVGSRRGIFATAPATGDQTTWLSADWKEVLGLATYTNPRRVEVATYRTR